MEAQCSTRMLQGLACLPSALSLSWGLLCQAALASSALPAAGEPGMDGCLHPRQNRCGAQAVPRAAVAPAGRDGGQGGFLEEAETRGGRQYGRRDWRRALPVGRRSG